jgi:hypothetical protein
MTADAKTVAAANLLRFLFMRVFLFWLWLLVFTFVRRLSTGSRIVGFLSGKAENAVETRQVFHPTGPNAGTTIAFAYKP